MLQQKGYSKTDENQILKYLPLVENIVDKMIVNSRQSMDRDDYITLGVFGLIDALNKFDDSKNIPFEHYAKWRIKGAIYDELRKNGSVSRSKMDKLNNMYKAKQELQQKLLREPSDKEICEYLKIDIKQLHDIYTTTHHLSHTFLEETLFSKDEEYMIIDILEDKDAPNPEKIIEEEEINNHLFLAIEKLPEREKIILNLYYFEELSLKEISEILDISISRVSQLHGKILLKLRKFLKSE